MSESIVGLAINKRQAFHFSIHEMISPRGLLGTLQEVSGDIAGASAMHTHPLFAETLSCDDDYEDDDGDDDCDYFHCTHIHYLHTTFF